MAKASAKKTPPAKPRKPAAKPASPKAGKPAAKSKTLPAGKPKPKATAKPAKPASKPVPAKRAAPLVAKLTTCKPEVASKKPAAKAASASKPTSVKAPPPRPLAASSVNGTKSAGKPPAAVVPARPVNGKPAPVAADGVKKTLVLVQSSEIKIKRPASVVATTTPVPRPRPVIDRMRPPEPVARYEPVKLPPPGLGGDVKPRKNRAGLNAKELALFRDLLLAKRRELVGDMSSMEREALRTQGSNLSNLPVHMADMGTDNYEQEFTLGLVEKDRSLLREINIALAKIQDGSYGICEGTGQPIAKPRLEAQPWAKYGIEYARLLERGLVRRPM